MKKFYIDSSEYQGKEKVRLVSNKSSNKMIDLQLNFDVEEVVQ